MDDGKVFDTLKQDLGSFSTDVQGIFVESATEVIERMRQLADDMFNDMKSVIDKGAEKTRQASEKAGEYVRQRPWETAAAFAIISIALGIISRKSEEKA